MDKVVLSLEARRVQLGLKQADIYKEIEKRGVSCNKHQYSAAVNKKMNTPKAYTIRRMADEILREKEGK